MKNLVLPGVLATVGTGIMIGSQATLTTRSSARFSRLEGAALEVR